MRKTLILLLVLSCFTNQSFAQSSDSGWRAEVGVVILPYNCKMIWNFDGVYGYHYSSGLFLGVGTGVILNPIHQKGNKTRLEIPVFGKVQYSFLNGQIVSPYIGAEIGILSDYTDHGNGYIARPFIGIGVKDFGISIGFTRLSATYDEIGKVNNEPSLIGGRYENSGVSVQLRYRF